MSKGIDLRDDLSVLPGVGPQKQAAFLRLGVKSGWDLLLYPPRKYLDFAQIRPIARLIPGPMTVKAALAEPPRLIRRRFRTVVEASFRDPSGRVKVLWFNQPYRIQQLSQHQDYFISGEYRFYRQRYQFVQPSIEEVSESPLSTARILGVYRQSRGLKSREIRRVARQLVATLPNDTESLPKAIVKRYGLLPLIKAVRLLHFPSSQKDWQEAVRRLSIDEVVAIQLAGLIEKRASAGRAACPIKTDTALAKRFVAALPFGLTDSQRKAMWRILQDISQDHPMNRLLEGDVGSGKTVVALLACLMVARAGFQTALIAPTTILAAQHYQTAKKLLGPFKVETLLLSAEMPSSKKKETVEKLRNPSGILAIGTHALLSEKVRFSRLGLIVVDEQHRFGVRQRNVLLGRSLQHPHVLTMTATPIPRSMALSLYCDLDLTVMRQQPAGRQRVKTKALSYAARNIAYDELRLEMDCGHQGYIIAPRISEDQEGVSIESLRPQFDKYPWDKYRILSLHGKAKPVEKQKVMASFLQGRTQAVLATSVVEVGVDNPNATVMIVEGADRFGLAQLHQLRGRVGRSHLAAQCYLISSPQMEISPRIKAMESIYDGLKLSLIDLKFRGPGALLGTRQHGPLELRFADILDHEILKLSRQIAQELITKYPDLSKLIILRDRVAAMRQTQFLN